MKGFVMLFIFFLSGEILFGDEEIMIRYYYVKCGFEPFGVFFAEEIAEENISGGYHKVYYDNNKLIKYETYLIPRGSDFGVNGVRRERNPADFELRLSRTVNYFYNVSNKLVRIISENRYSSAPSEITIEYISDISAIYRETRNGEDIYEGELLYDGNDIISFSLANSRQNTRFDTLYVNYIYQDNSIKLIQYTDFRSIAEWELISDQQKNIVSYNYTRFD